MRHLLVFGEKTFKIEIPDNAKVTFGPWSPKQTKRGYVDENHNPNGTLRVYKGDGPKETGIIACFSNVSGFRDLSLGYAEQVAKEEGATIWKDDDKGYVREHKVSVQKEWVQPQLETQAPAVKRGRKASK